MDKWQSLKEYLEDKINTCTDELTKRELKQTLRKMMELETKEKVLNRSS